MTTTTTRVGEGVTMAAGAGSNWVVLVDGNDVTLIDTGYPGDLRSVESSLAEAGRRVEDVVAILVTHAHIDHVGALPELVRRSGASVYTGERETHHLAGEYHEVATPLDVARRAYLPRTWIWMKSVLPVGVLTKVSYPDAIAVAEGVELDVPGRPVPVVTTGHTSGHTCYLLPDVGAVATGDALVSAHALLPQDGPQLLPAFFTHDQDQARESLRLIGALDADVIVPGHGPVLTMAAAEAARRAGGS